MGLVTAGFWLGTILIEGRFRKPNLFHALVLVFFLWNFVSLFWSSDLENTMKRIKTYSQIFLLMLIYWEMLQTPQNLLAGLQAYVVGAYVLVASTIYNYLAGNVAVQYEGRYSATGVNANDVALILILCLPIALHLLFVPHRDRTGIFLKGINFLYIPLAIYSSILTGSRTSLIVIIPFLIFLVGTQRIKVERKFIIFVILLITFFAFLPFVPASIIDRLGTIGNSIGGADLGGRVAMWRKSIMVLAEHPLLGVGSGAIDRAIGGAVHNTLLSVVGETGFVGLLLFLSIIGLVVYQLARLPQKTFALWLTVFMTWVIAALSLSWEFRKATWIILSFVIIESSFAKPVPEQIGKTNRLGDVRRTLKPGILVLLIGLAVLTACTISRPVNILAPNTRAPQGQYYYVSTQGNDADPGTKGLPFRTISRAAGVAKAGDVVLIGAGVYYEDVKPLHSGEPDNYITYRNEGDGQVIIDAQDGQRPACIEINNKSYLQFIGLTVRGANSYQTWPRAGISITDGANHIILDNITAYNNFVGIMAHGSENAVSFITVKKSKTFGPGNMGNIHQGIFFYKKVSDSSIVDNHVAYTSPEEQSYGIEVSTDFPGSQANGARRIVISGNEVDHNESEGIHTWNATGVLIRNNYLHDNGATGIQIEDGSESIVIENNLSENNAQTYEFEAGVWIDDSENAVVRNNILRNNKVGLIITGSDRVIVHDNYVYLNNRGAENLVNAAGLIVEDSVANISLTHNTFYRNGATGMPHGAVNFGLFNPSCTSITFKNNIVTDTANVLDLFQDSCSDFVSDFNAFSNVRALAIEWNQNRTDWAAYLAVSGQDSHSLTDAPIFVDPSSFNFSLQPASPLIGKGTILTRATDAGRGKKVGVVDASYFTDGFGIGSGDSIVIGSSQVKIMAIDYTHGFISVDQEIQWDQNAIVSFPFAGNAPDMGASDMP